MTNTVPTQKAWLPTPIGNIEITGNSTHIYSIDFQQSLSGNIQNKHETLSRVMFTAITQLQEYFEGKRKTFTFPIMIDGTPFQKSVWEALTEVPYSNTRSYLDIAKQIGNEKSVRAVAQANHSNKFAIVIPCHRIIGSDGSLTGYGGGLWRKEWLLKHERQHAMRGL